MYFLAVLYDQASLFFLSNSLISNFYIYLSFFKAFLFIFCLIWDPPIIFYIIAFKKLAFFLKTNFFIWFLLVHFIFIIRYCFVERFWYIISQSFYLLDWLHVFLNIKWKRYHAIFFHRLMYEFYHVLMTRFLIAP